VDARQIMPRPSPGHLPGPEGMPATRFNFAMHFQSHCITHITLFPEIFQRFLLLHFVILERGILRLEGFG
jgi:hypothetical protein